MKHLKIAIFALATSAFVACKDDKKDTTEIENENEVTTVTVDTDAEKSSMMKMTVALSSKSGSKAKGSVNFSESNGNVALEAKLEGLTPGMHAIHIHEKADCSSDDGKSSGGHWNPTFEQHGKWGSQKGYHKGDIGNFNVNADGTGSISMITDEWCIGCGDDKKDILGKAIIVHKGIDDFVSQPSGDAGARVSCGGIIK